MFATTSIRLLVLSVTALLIGFGSYMVGPALVSPLTDIRLEPQRGTVVVGGTFPVTVIVSSQEPVNVFQGELVYDPTLVEIVAIDYNTSIANLWAERPWYENGKGTMNFIGGTTQEGGFIGSGTLVTITFKSITPGTVAISMREARVLKHDGLGSEAALGQPIDAIFAVAALPPEEVIFEKSGVGPTVTVVEKTPSTDLNGDGLQTVVDLSLFMTDLATQNMRSDFNLDGGVDVRDLSILRSAP